jgi:hypothetical protein
MRRIWAPLGSRILPAGRILHAKSEPPRPPRPPHQVKSSSQNSVVPRGEDGRGASS